MRVSQAKELFRALTASYFVGAEVTFARQSRAAKPRIPLVTLTPENVSRPFAPIEQTVDGVTVGHYPSRIRIQVDLFTHGTPILDEGTGRAAAYENTAMDDMLSFADFLNSPYTTAWCHEKDVSILIDGEIMDLTGLLNESNYEFRSRLSVLFGFTQTAVGYAAVLSEDSIQYAAGAGDEETGGPACTPEPPKETESAGGPFKPGGGMAVRPHFEQTSSGGGTEELAAQQTGYFTEAEIKEDRSQ